LFSGGTTFLPKFTQHTDNTDDHKICVSSRWHLVVAVINAVAIAISCAVAVFVAAAITNRHFFQDPFS
jgi:hypothetical protein